MTCAPVHGPALQCRLDLTRYKAPWCIAVRAPRLRSSPLPRRRGYARRKGSMLHFRSRGHDRRIRCLANEALEWLAVLFVAGEYVVDINVV